MERGEGGDPLRGAPITGLRSSAEILPNGAAKDARRGSLTYNILGAKAAGRVRQRRDGGPEEPRKDVRSGGAPTLEVVSAGAHVGRLAGPPQTGDTAVSATPRRARRSRQTLRLWTFDQAQAAVPYIASIVRSLRECVLDMQSLRRRLGALEDKPGRPDRSTLIAIEEARRDLLRKEEAYGEALEELDGLDIQVLDAATGQVLVPFVHDDQLAWYIFDLFDSQPIRSWRFQSDPDETRRKLTAAQMS